MSRRALFKTIDQRTGRKIRGLDAVYDGEIPSLLVKRGEDDPPHPLNKPFTPGVDRAMLLNARAENGNYVTSINVGFDAGDNLWAARGSIPSISVSSGGGTLTIDEAFFGWGDDAWGNETWGGYFNDLEVAF